jgi:ABC-type sugar transport system ATPase subunit
MRELRAGGRSIIFISHKLKESRPSRQHHGHPAGKVVGERPPTPAASS